MKRIVLTQLALTLAVAAYAADAPAASTATASTPVTAAPKPAREASSSTRLRVAVGDSATISLPCNPTTGYQWELESIDRAIAVPDGDVRYEKGRGGAVGGGGTCALSVKGVKPGRTKAVLVYRRSWEKGAPAKTFTARLTVVAKP